MADKLGFTFYPKDWWASDTYFSLDPFERYVFLECVFLMYSNNGVLTHNKTQIENRIRAEIKPNSWDKITQSFISTDLGFTLMSVNKRLKKSITNRINGQKGGRPPKPKKPNTETQNNPPSEREREREEERENNINNKHFVEEANASTQWVETACMQFGCSVEDLNEKIKQFEGHLIITENQKKDLSDFKNHFSNWMQRQPKQSESNTASTNQLQPKYDD